MPFPKDRFDPETLELMQRAFNSAWEVVDCALARAVHPEGVKTMMALRIMAAVRDGETNTERLKELAVGAVGGLY
jgi:hypothetical protein